MNRATAGRLVGVMLCLSLVPCTARAGRSKTPTAPTGAEGWPPITQEERDLKSVPQDPEADAVILRTERVGRIVEEGDETVNVLHYHWRLKVLTERGKDYAEIHIPAAKGSRVSGIEARTIRPDGSIVPVAPDQIFEKVVAKIGAVRQSEWVFSFPAVEVGAILEYHYQRVSSYLVFLSPWFFQDEAFTLSSRVSQGVPGGMSYSILCALCPPDANPAISESHEGGWRGQMYSVELKNLPGYRGEFLMPPLREASPRLEMLLDGWKHVQMPALGRQDRFFTDWNAVAQYASYYYENAIKDGRKEISDLAAGWVQGVQNPQAKIAAVLRHVEDDFRYVSWPTVFGESRSVTTILKDKTADNEEKAVLLVAALRAIGLEPVLALVSGRDYGSVNPKFFSLSQFSHTVAGLPRPDGTMEWLDPTEACAPPGFVPWRDSGAQALILRGRQGELVDLPAKNELNTTRYRVTMRPRRDGKTELDVAAEFQGEDAVDLRELLRDVSEDERRSALQNWVQGERPGAVLSSFTIGDLDHYDTPFTLDLKAEAPGLVTVADELLVTHACVLGCYDTTPVPRASRAHPFFVDRGWNVETTVTVVPPAGMTAMTMPPPVVAKSALASLVFSCSSQGDGSARCTRQWVARRNRWPAGEVRNVRTMFDSILKADQSTLAFQPAAGAAP
ncbi:MAG TPA: DUF3857 and transglutaminase domain-containing protein, partial [Candidatus Polarisedimenticolia bacterium]|nr:DUF3857 and transglutaminase domain-containing protein [Candidatus Polarisedimenticolia bacterium]